MRFVQRLTVPCIGFLLALVALHLQSSNLAIGDDPAEKREPIVIGPFKLGDWLDESKVEIQGSFDDLAPDRKEIIKSLNECEVYLFDQRITTKGKGPRFDYPKLVATGKLHHVWESKSGRFVIQIATLTASPNMTDYFNKPAARRALVNVTVQTHESNGKEYARATISFGPQKLIPYNINGESK